MFLQTSSPLFQLFYFVDCKRIVLKMIFRDGRILILQVVIDDKKLVCANIYAPNDPGAQHRFYLHVNNILQKFSSERIILGSDFNCPLSKEDKEGGRDFSHKYHVAEEIKSLM